MRHLFILIIVALCGAVSHAQSADTPTIPQADKPFRIHYMGNIEAANIFPWQDFMNNSAGVVSLTTTHGVQFTPYLYAGAGIGAWMMYYHDGVGLAFTVYGNARATLPLRSRFRPFVDIKAGRVSYSSFVSPALGCKYYWGTKGGVYLAFGSDCIFNDFESQWLGLSLRLGFDF